MLSGLHIIDMKLKEIEIQKIVLYTPISFFRKELFTLVFEFMTIVLFSK